MSQRVLIYGSRTWTDACTIRAFVATLPPGTVVVHGAQKTWDDETKAYHGADYFADQAAREFGLDVEPHPAKWNLHVGCTCRDRSKRCYFAGPRRNQEMVDSGLDRAQGFRMPGESRGTDDMTRKLEAAGVPHKVETP